MPRRGMCVAFGWDGRLAAGWIRNGKFLTRDGKFLWLFKMDYSTSWKLVSASARELPPTQTL
jgi:hypothetical protein